MLEDIAIESKGEGTWEVCSEIMESRRTSSFIRTEHSIHATDDRHQHRYLLCSDTLCKRQMIFLLLFGKPIAYWRQHSSFIPHPLVSPSTTRSLRPLFNVSLSQDISYRIQSAMCCELFAPLWEWTALANPLKDVLAYGAHRITWYGRSEIYLFKFCPWKEYFRWIAFTYYRYRDWWLR